METIIVIVATLFLFIGMILMLAAKPKFSGKLTGACIVIAGVGGLFFYGYGFAMNAPNLPMAIIRALLGVCGIYMGRTDYSAVSGTPLLAYDSMQLLFWTVHLIALYATASAAITTVGAKALRKLRLWLARWGTLNLIYGVNDKTLNLGKKLLEENAGAVVFVSSKADAGHSAAIAQNGCVLRSDESALKADRKFAKTIGAHRKGRKITLYALEDTPSSNLQYAEQLLKTLEGCQAAPEKTRLVIQCQENAAAAQLQTSPTAYGYGFVSVVQEAGLAARLLIRHYPPCNYVQFQGNGEAAENFETLIVGFGKVGQAVLRQLVMNGQFEGSTFRATVVAPDCNAVKGHFSSNYGQILNHYDIQFLNCDARSEDMYAYLGQQGKNLKYIVLCAGTKKTNEEIAENLMEYFQSKGMEIPVFQCSHQGVKQLYPEVLTEKAHELYSPEVLSMARLDAMAIAVNDRYQNDKSQTPLQHWMGCDYFSRMSCRATADFAPANLRMAGMTLKQVQEQGWNLTPEQLETMSKTEHLRWCAFHYCMGFSPMTEGEYDQRVAEFARQKAAGEKPLRIGKNMRSRTHACLIDWEQLPELSRKESAITGRPVDYCAMDTDNVFVITELLRSGEKAEV